MGSCQKSELEKYRELISINTSMAIYQIVDLKTGEIKLDTIETNWDGTRFIKKEINNFNENDSLLLAEISTYDFKKDVVIETFLNYDLNGDSIRHLDTSSYEIGKIKLYNIEEKSFEIIKEPRSIFNKSRTPNRYTFVSKNFGLIATLSRTKKVILHSFEQRELTKEESKLIEILNKDEKFFNLKKEN